MRSAERSQLRRRLDDRNDRAHGVRQVMRPANGWLRAVREALGMSASQVASRLSVSMANVLKTEGREEQGTVSLAVMQKQAEAMGCRFVYMIVPADAESFEDMVDAQARRVVARLSKRTNHTMSLEDQQVANAEADAQAQTLATKLKKSWQTGYWDAGGRSSGRMVRRR